MTTTGPDLPLILGALAVAGLLCGLYGMWKGHGFVVPALLGFACFPLAAVVIMLKAPGDAKKPRSPSTPGDGDGRASGAV